MARLSDAMRRRRRFVFIEESGGTFVLASGASPATSMSWRDGRFIGAPAWRGGEVEFRLTPARCVFRELELPARAAEFLEGVARAQVDRVSPWRANEAAFGWSAPSAREGDRIAVWLAVAKREPVVELAGAAAAAGADSVAITTVRAEGAAPIEILGQRVAVASRNAHWRFAIVALLFAAIGMGFAAVAAEATLGADIEAQTEGVTADLASRRAALLRIERAGDDPAAKALDARKGATPSAVIVLEALSRALPDEAYLTEMRLEGEKLEIAGVAGDAADLIHDIESSPHFAAATFTAPTTRAAGGEGESFRIEARVKPRLTVSP